MNQLNQNLMNQSLELTVLMPCLNEEGNHRKMYRKGPKGDRKTRFNRGSF